jgi:phosphatidate cytidylyltransferase
LVLWGHPYLLTVVVILITEVGVWEFFRLAESSGSGVLRIPGYAFASLFAASWASPRWFSFRELLGATTYIFPLVLLAWALLSNRKLNGFLGSVASTLLGILYVSVPLSLLVWICTSDGFPERNGRYLVLFGLILVWTSDTMAFFIGLAWGRHKLWPRISPGKTWEGSAASLVAAVLVGFFFVRFLGRNVNYIEAAILSVLINIAAQLGDLAESALKRGAGVKDSSNLLPGHGGVLDRIDALLFAAPVLWYYWLWKWS